VVAVLIEQKSSIGATPPVGYLSAFRIIPSPHHSPAISASNGTTLKTRKPIRAYIGVNLHGRRAARALIDGADLLADWLLSQKLPQPELLTAGIDLASGLSFWADEIIFQKSFKILLTHCGVFCFAPSPHGEGCAYGWIQASTLRKESF
jgi:hypothetical protein